MSRSRAATGSTCSPSWHGAATTWSDGRTSLAPRPPSRRSSSMRHPDSSARAPILASPPTRSSAEAGSFGILPGGQLQPPTPANPRREAAVVGNDASGHIGRVVGGDKGVQPSDLVRCARPVHGDLELVLLPERLVLH